MSEPNLIPLEETDTPSSKRPEEGIGICLSGGGYRAMLYHIGALWRLNETGLLTSAARISSVSGGSITSACLGLAWAKKKWANDGTPIPDAEFKDELVNPVRHLAGKTLDIPSILAGALPWTSVGEQIAKRYDRYLFKGATLQDLPDQVRFVINASNLQTGRLWRFSKPYMEDYTVGPVFKPTLNLSEAVAASSGFPPVLSPIRLRLKESDFGSWPDSPTPPLQKPPYTTRPVLSDGGVYDNLGMETVYKRYRTIFVSDGGGQFYPSGKVSGFWPTQAVRVMVCTDNQVRSLRKRELMSSYETGDRSGAYWGMGTSLSEYHKEIPLKCSAERTKELADFPTRLKAVQGDMQMQLINWGYASCAASLISNDPNTSPTPDPQWPFPEQSLG